MGLWTIIGPIIINRWYIIGHQDMILKYYVILYFMFKLNYRYKYKATMLTSLNKIVDSLDYRWQWRPYRLSKLSPVIIMTTFVPIILIQLYLMSSNTVIQHLANKLVCGEYFVVQNFVKTSINYFSWPIYLIPLESFRLMNIIIFHT